ncbi:calnexin-like isoform X2 [Babylonia areolata]|uniref:calnexin-like isoform X2 n=1 Tax=Babylonia areolata TaxID=304850 RepID=UPI003FD3A7B9
MRIWRTLLLLSIFGLTLLSITRCDTEVDDEDEDDDEDGQVEVEDENEPIVEEPPRERPKYERPVPKAPVFFHEPFDSKESFSKRWTVSQAKKDGAEESIAKYDGKWDVEEPKSNPIEGDLGLILKSKAKHHAVATELDKPFEFTGKPFVVQYEVRFQNGMDCGGAYIKLLSKETSIDLKSFHDKTPYTIMFGPDKCGMDHKLHFIFRHKNPKTGEIEEKHAKKPTANIDSYFTDRKTHLYTLVVNPDQTFEMRIDHGVVNKGSLLEDFNPPVNPPKEIEDPNDKKPADWDDREKIPDPEATKPDDWDENEPSTIIDPDATKPDGWLDDEPRLVPDPEAVKPDDWDDEMDGEWEAPLIDNVKCKEAPGCGEWEAPSIPNPKYRGKWKPPMIDNPNYKGVWKPRMIENPAYFEDSNPYKMTPIGALGLELWSMSDDIMFDNFLIADDIKVAEEFAAASWEIKSNEERAASSAGRTIVEAIKEVTDERPWLWAVFIIVVVLPIVLIVAYCCMSKPEDVDSMRKKTDEPSPDDEEEEEEKEGEGERKVDVGAGGDSGSDKKPSQADLEASEDAVDEGEEADAEEDEDAKASPKRSPRRRKARKE